MRYILPLILLSGCASADQESPGTQIQQAVTYVTATNNFASLPNLNINLCHLVFVEGAGANSQSAILPGNVPECGGIVSTGSTVLSAHPNSCVTPQSAQQGTMSATARCQPLSDFGPVTQGSTLFTNMWGGTGSLEHVSFGQQMLALTPTTLTRNACYLSGMGSMSVGNEYSWLTYSSTHAWLNSDGYKGLSTEGRCSRLGRQGGITHTLQATPGNDAIGPAVSTHTCLVTQVNGTIDNGGFSLQEPGGLWELRVWDGVTYGRADCYKRL